MFYINNDVETIDKYDFSKFIKMEDDGAFDPLTSYFLYRIPQLPLQGTYVIRTDAERPDLLSHNIYGDTQYWWILLVYNGLMKAQDLKVGLKIGYPSFNAVEQVYMDASLYSKTE